MNLRLTKDFVFEMAHALPAYDGLCSNIHGHSYHLSLTIEGSPITDPSSPHCGMVLDFRQMKHIVEETILSLFDHALVLPSDAPYNVEGSLRIVRTPFQPTTENLLLYFARLLEQRFADDDALPPSARLYSLRLSETATSTAELFW